jgi:hypothetical protein
MKRLAAIIIGLLLMAGIAGATDYHPSARHFGVGNIYHGTRPLTVSTASVYASRYDMILNGLVGNGWSLRDSLYIYNPSMMTGNYSNLHMLGHRHIVSGDNYYVAHEYHEFMTLWAAASMPAESAFVHYGGSKLMASLSGGERYFNLDSLRTAECDSCLRVSLRAWNNIVDSGVYYPASVGDWLCNMTSPTYRTIRAKLESFMWTHTDSLWGQVQPNQYGYADNWCIWTSGPAFCQPTYWLTNSTCHIDSSKSAAGNWTASTDSVDWDIQLNISPNQTTLLQSAYASLAAEVQDSLQAQGFKGYVYNVGPTDSTRLAQFAAAADPGGHFYELQGGNIFEKTCSENNGWNIWNRRIRGVHAANANVLQLLEFRFNTIVDTSYPAAKTQYVTALAIAYCIQEQDSTVLFQIGEMDQNNWFEAWQVDIGWPTAATPAESTVTDLASKTGQKIIVRPYDHGLAIWRPLMTAGNDTTATSGYIMHLGKQMYQIGMHADSTLLSDSTITVKAQHGYVLQDAGSLPLISATPAVFTFTATIGEAVPGTQILTIKNTGSGSLNWTATKAQAWLSLSPGSGIDSTAVTLSVSTAGKPIGIFTDTITVSDATASNNPQKRVVTLEIKANASMQHARRPKK